LPFPIIGIPNARIIGIFNAGPQTPVYLHARGVRGGVAVSIAATVFDEKEDTR
jgi:hypothetical protein